MRFSTLIVAGLLLSESVIANQLPDLPSVSLPTGVTLREVINRTTVPLINGSLAEDEGCFAEIKMPKFQFEREADKTLAFKRLSRKWFRRGLRSVNEFLKATEENERCTEEFFSNYQLNLEYSFASQHGNMVTMVYTHYEYSGGAHGYVGYSKEFLDFETGKQIPSTLDHFLKPEFLPAVKAIMDFKLKQDEYFDPEFGWNSWKSETTQMSEIDDFYFSPTGIVFFFNPYAIGPYSSGIIQVELSWEEISSMKQSNEFTQVLP